MRVDPGDYVTLAVVLMYSSAGDGWAHGLGRYDDGLAFSSRRVRR